MKVTAVRKKELARRDCLPCSESVRSAWARYIDAGTSSVAGYNDCSVASANTLQHASR